MERDLTDKIQLYVVTDLVKEVWVGDLMEFNGGSHSGALGTVEVTYGKLVSLLLDDSRRLDQASHGSSAKKTMYISKADCLDIPTDWLDNDLCRKNLTMFMRLTVDHHCYKKEWGNVNVKVKLDSEMPKTDQLKGRNQFQDVLKTLMSKGLF
ncbi:hypothetical protein HWV62_36033 [Athelia sp. TMB]|nr:hypothetical protein HWV62_36033 [Athelia sp. TMB]